MHGIKTEQKCHIYAMTQVQDNFQFTETSTTASTRRICSHTMSCKQPKLRPLIRIKTHFIECVFIPASDESDEESTLLYPIIHFF